MFQLLEDRGTSQSRERVPRWPRFVAVCWNRTAAADGTAERACYDAQHLCCANAQHAQRFWGPLGAGILLRALQRRATRALREPLAGDRAF